MTTYRTIVGLDIGVRTVKAVRIVRQRGRWKAVQTEMLRLPADTREAPAPLIARWLQTNSLSQHPLALSLSGHAVMFQTINLHPEDPRSKEQAAGMEVARFQEMAAEETAHAVLDIKGGGGRRLLLIMARAAMLDGFIKTYRDLGLKVVAIVPATVALFNFTAPLMRERSEPYIIADIGTSRTDLGVALRGSLLFGRSLAGFGGQWEEAGAPKADSDSAVTEWLEELRAGLTMYNSIYTEPAMTPGALLPAGDACDYPGFAATVGSLSDIPPIPWKDLLTSGYPREPHRFAVATGAAITLLPGAIAPVNLLPPAIQEELLLKTQKRYWAAASVTGILTLSLLMLGGYRNAFQAQRRLETERQTVRRCQELAGRIETQKRHAELIFAMTAPPSDLLANGMTLQDLIIVIAAHKSPDDIVTMISDDESYFPPSSHAGRPAVPRSGPGLFGRGQTAAGHPSAAAPEGKRAAGASIDRVIVEGFTPHHDLSTVSALITRLRETPFIDPRTDMLGDDKLVAGNVWTNLPPTRGLRRFVIDIYLRPSVPSIL